MKKLLSVILSVAMVVTMLMSVVPASAGEFPTYMDYHNQIGNEATLETLEDAVANAPAEVAKYYNNGSKVYITSPLMADIPAGTAYVYRSANFYGGQCAVRNNTAIIVCTDEKLDSLDAVAAWLDKTVLKDMIDALIGSVIVMTPADGAAFGEADVATFAAIQNGIMTRSMVKQDDGSYAYTAENEYCGSYGKVYLVGIDGGATFINNYVAPAAEDYIGRYAGICLVGGEIAEGVKLSNYIPAYLVNASDAAVAAYREAAGTDTLVIDGAAKIYTNSANELLTVTATEGKIEDGVIALAFMDQLLYAQRTKNTRAGTPAVEPLYLDEVPAPAIQTYSLVKRNPIMNGFTLKGGSIVTFHKSEQFKEYISMYDQYLQTWYEVLPASVTEHTAAEHSVPLILALHGTGDDPLMYIDEIGLLEVADAQGVAIVAPFEEELVVAHEGGLVVMGVPIYEAVALQAWPALINYMLETYPELDPSRVYSTGYSLGGGSTYRAVVGGGAQIAANVPMAGMHPDMAGILDTMTEEQDQALIDIGMPTLVLTSTYDLGYNGTEGRLADWTLNTIDKFCKWNGLAIGERDFATYPIIGMPSDAMDLSLTEGENRTFHWYCYNEAGVPVLQISCTENMTHSLYAPYGEIAWEFMSHFSRDLETGAVIYTE